MTRLTIFALATVAATAADYAPNIPKTWDDAAIATHEVPLANPAGSPKHVSSDYYYYYRVPLAGPEWRGGPGSG